MGYGSTSSTRWSTDRYKTRNDIEIYWYNELKRQHAFMEEATKRQDWEDAEYRRSQCQAAVEMLRRMNEAFKNPQKSPTMRQNTLVDGGGASW